MPSDLPDQIQLTVLLSGGQQYTIAMPPDNPLLQQLFEVLMDSEQTRTRRLFQIPIDQGQAMLAFPCTQLIGVITEPPLLIQPQADPAALANPIAARNPLSSDYVQIEDFLSPQEQQQLLNYVLQQQSNFVSTSTSTGQADHRRSIVLHAFPKFAQLITQRIQAVLPQVLVELELPSFPISQIETQLTAHNDGHYYKPHNDNGSPDTASRQLTYVYYFHKQPKPFSGGELLIYDSQIEDGFFVQAETFRTVEPRNNSIVFFPSRYVHEVLPIRCPSKAFADSRFTINGWIRRSPLPE